jgi:hypothetical protein
MAGKILPWSSTVLFRKAFHAEVAASHQLAARARKELQVEEMRD